MSRTWREGLTLAYTIASVALLTIMHELDVREWIIWCTGAPLVLGGVLIGGWMFSKER
jgi:hypothetical protein